MAHALTTCTFCGAGCGIYLETSANRIVGAYPSSSHPTNQGRLCVRGWNVNEVASAADRLTKPLLQRGGQLEEASWEEAFDFIALRLKKIRERYGPEAIGFLNSPRCSNEESYLLQKFARTVIGTNNVDHGTGVYSNNSIDVLLEMLGVPAGTASLADLSCNDVIVVDGVDLGQQLPTVGGLVMRAKLKGAKLIVIDARRQRLAESADHYLQINPGSDALLYGAMAKIILDRGLMKSDFIQARCGNYEEFARRVRSYDLLWCAQRCGLSAAQIEGAAIAYGQAASACILYSTGAEARTTEAIQALINVVLLTGNIGRRGAGLIALTEQNNLQGVCDVGVLPDRLPGYQAVSDDAARRRFEKFWNCQLPTQPGLSATQMLTPGGESKIKALWLSRYDPMSTAFFSDLGAAFKNLELVVMQHLFMVETAKHAHVVLPVVAFGEERVTFTNTERRIQIAERVVDPPQGVLAAWEQWAAFAKIYGADWNYDSSAQIMDEVAQAVPFYSGAHHDNLARNYGRQWPCTHDKMLGSRSLFEDGIEGRPFKFVAIQRPVVAMCHEATGRPFALILGRSLYYWHRNVLIQHSETLKREYRMLLLDYPKGFVEINPDDAKRLELRDGSKIKLTSETGSASTYARVTREIKPGTIFVPYFLHEVMQQLLGRVVFDMGHRSRPICVSVEKA